jgi:site-specific recombinase XerD
MQALLNVVHVRSRTGLRDRALLLLLYNTGARVSEVVRLEPPDVRLDGAGQVKLFGKGRKTRFCPLWSETVQALRTCLSHRQPKEPQIQQIFLDANGRPITRFGIAHVIGRYAARALRTCPSMAGKTITPHTIRHYSASLTMPSDVGSQARSGRNCCPTERRDSPIPRHSSVGSTSC